MFVYARQEETVVRIKGMMAGTAGFTLLLRSMPLMRSV